MKHPLREQARDRDCQIRTDECNRDPETTVLCHVHKPSIGGGAGLKVNDFIAAHGCSACHDRVDGRSGRPRTYREVLEDTVDLYEGVFRTQKLLMDEGILWQPIK